MLGFSIFILRSLEIKLLPDFVSKFESMGLNVLEPFFRNSQVDMAKPGWPNKVAFQTLMI